MLENYEEYYKAGKVNVNIIELNDDINALNTDIGTQSKVNIKVKGNMSTFIFDDITKEMKIAKYFYSVLCKSRPEQKSARHKHSCRQEVSPASRAS